MICKKCGSQLEEGAKFCTECGAKVEVDQEIIGTTDNIQSAQNFSVKNNNNNANLPKRKSILWIFLALIILLVTLSICYLTVYNSSKNYYKRSLAYSIDSTLSNLFKIYSDNKKTNITLEANSNIELEQQVVDQSLLDTIKELVIKLNLQTDIENKKVAWELDTKYKNSDLLKCLLIQQDSNVYVYSKDILGEKYIKVDEKKFEENFDIPSITLDQKISYNKAKKELIKEAKNVIKDKYCSKKSQGLDNIYTLEISEIDIMTELQELVQNLSENQAFLNCFSEKDEIKQNLMEFSEKAKKYSSELSEDVTLKIDIIASILTQKVKNFSVTELSNEEVTSQIDVQINNNSYKYQLKNKEKELLNGQVNVNKQNDKTNYVIIANVPSVGKITLNITTGINNNVEIKNINNNESINVDDITEEELNKIMERMEKSQIKVFIDDLTNGLNLSSLNLNQSSLNSLNNEDDQIVVKTNDTNIDEGKESFDSSIETYDQKINIKYNSPFGYKVISTEKEYNSYSNGNTNILVSTSPESVDEYLGKQNSKINTYTTGNWANAKMSEKKEIKLGDKVCYYKEFDYDYISQNYISHNHEMYICTKLDDKNTYIVEIDSIDEEIPTDILPGLFDISVK